jgi:hypothetical protein
MASCSSQPSNLLLLLLLKSSIKQIDRSQARKLPIGVSSAGRRRRRESRDKLLQEKSTTSNKSNEVTDEK